MLEHKLERSLEGLRFRESTDQGIAYGRFRKFPCMTMWEETEWVETVERGWNVLVGADPVRIYQEALEARPGAEAASPYGDGKLTDELGDEVCGCN